MQPPRPRERQPDPIVLQPRDGNALLMVYFCDGVMSEAQIIRSCYPDTHPKNAAKRLLALFDNKYLNRNWRLEKWQLYPRLLYWLADAGYDEVALALGEEPDRSNKMARSLLPSTLNHHLQVVDIRLKIIADVAAVPGLHLGRWFTEGYFRSKAWQGRVTYLSASGKKTERPVEPDAFFPVWRYTDASQARQEVFGFTLEVDRATETQLSLSPTTRTTIDEKLRKGAALVDSRVYRETFGLQTGRCLMVTTGWERAENMMEMAQEAGVGWAWYFTTFDDFIDEQKNVLVSPLWRQAGRAEPVHLFQDPAERRNGI